MENREPLLSDSISITSLAFERSVEFLRPCVATSAPIDRFVFFIILFVHAKIHGCF